MTLRIGYLYADLMNIYGDTGNVITLQKRCEWRGIEAEVKIISLGDKLKSKQVDIYFFGGGQDQSQQLVASDLGRSGKGEVIREDVERGVPLLSICGGYQLLGEYYQPFDPGSGSVGVEGKRLQGVGLFQSYTEAGFDRMIGNIVIESNFGKLVGFENHSGKTYLREGTQALGRVIKGYGNNGEDRTEGCLYKNAVGCYMHGSLLPKNPRLADWLIQKALETKYGDGVKLKELDDSLENLAHDLAVSKFA